MQNASKCISFSTFGFVDVSCLWTRWYHERPLGSTWYQYILMHLFCYCSVQPILSVVRRVFMFAALGLR